MKTAFDDDVIGTTPYDTDFYIWTQEQAALLRQVPRAVYALDVDHIAEEIEDMGHAEISKGSSLLRQVLIHLPKLAIAPDSSSLDDLLTTDFDLGRIMERVTAAVRTPAR